MAFLDKLPSILNKTRKFWNFKIRTLATDFFCARFLSIMQYPENRVGDLDAKSLKRAGKDNLQNIRKF